MENWVIWSDATITDGMLRDFVTTRGGRWQKDPVQEGILERGDARVFLTKSPAASLQPEDFRQGERRLGKTPETLISIHIGHGAGSKELAKETAEMVLQAWPGVLDENEP